MTTNALGQIVEIDTLNQNDLSISEISWFADTTLISIPLPQGINENQLFIEFKNRMDTANYETPDYVGLQLNIDKEGNLTKIIVQKGKNGRTIQECVRVAKTFQKWEPAILEYKGRRFTQAMSISLPIILKE